MDGVYANRAGNFWVYDNDIVNASRNGIYVRNSSGTNLINDIDIWKNRINGAGDATGIRIENSDFATIGAYLNYQYGESDSIATGNVITGVNDGIIVKNSNNALLIYSTINDVSGNAITVRESSNAIVKLNDIDHVGGNGIYVYASDYSDIMQNDIHGTGVNGIYLSGSDYSDIVDNYISDTGEHAVKVNPSDFVNISYNDIYNARWDGIHVDNGRYSDIYENRIRRSGDDGIDVDNNQGVDIYSNIINVTGLIRRDGNGIKVSNSLNADINRNIIRNAGDDGIDVEYSRNIDIKGNRIVSSGDDGIDVEDSDYADIRRNTIIGSYDDGIELRNSSHVDIVNNQIRRSGENAIQIHYGHEIKVKRNKIRISGGNGIYANSVDDVFVINNKVRNSYENGLYIAGAYNGYVRFQGNRLTDNGILSGSAAARFESGDIDMSNLGNPNRIINTTGLPAIGLQFDDISGTGLRIVEETLGSTIFDGFIPEESFYVLFEDGSILDSGTGNPIVIDGTNASFDGIIPTSTGNILSAGDLAFIEDRLYDADDVTVNGRGQIFIGAVATDTQTIENFEDFFPRGASPSAKASGASLIIEGLPPTGAGGLDLNNIEPAAGNNNGGDPEELANISPASGGEGDGEGEAKNVTCIGDVIGSMSGGSVTYNFGGTFEDSIKGEATCSSTDI